MENNEKKERPEFLVGIGASAGGLEALQDFFNNMSPVDGLAFVVIQHLSPDFKSLMNQLLSNFTKMQIKIVENKMPLEKNTVYLIPPKNNMIVEGGTLYLYEQERGHFLNLPIDIFFRSMAKDYLNKSIAVVLSGTGSDGSSGIVEVASVGGLIIAQEPEAAQFDGMPRSAINTQVVNKVLPANKIPAFISDFLKNPILQKDELEKEEYNKTDDNYDQIFRLLQKKFKVDFTEYKESTIYRRIDRRAKTLLISSVDEYVKKLFDDENELECLFKDMLIGVTSFFRDPDAFKILEEQFVPNLFAAKEELRQLRVWIPACSTGEEAYSMAILLKECSERLKKAYDIKIFASDISKGYLGLAAQGCYTEANLIHVSKERKERFFMKKGDRYYVIPELRNMIVFAPQSLMADPPFTNVDFVSCRNFLIYIKGEAQKKVFSSFHFSLNKGGILFLGPSEGVGDFSNDFVEENRLWKIYRKVGDHKIPFPLEAKRNPSIKPAAEYLEPRLSRKAPRLLKQLVYDVLLEEYLEDSIIVDDEEEIIHVTGKAAKFLNLQTGRMSNNIFRLINPAIRSTMISAMHKAQADRHEIIYNRITAQVDDKDLTFDISLRPLVMKQENYGLIVMQFRNFYEKTSAEKAASVYEMSNRETLLINDLEYQLQATKENLQAALEESETTNEELQSTNEELLASNEELQSTNEELHSVNEELYTVNSEHQKKISELEILEDDIDNIVHSSGIGTIFLDENICIRKITPAITESYNILPHDVGRSIETFSYQFNNENFLKKVKEVQLYNKSQFLESVDSDGNSRLIKILPYSGQKKKKGIVITFTDLTQLKLTESKLSQMSKDLDESQRQIDDLAALTASDIQKVLNDVSNEIRAVKCSYIERSEDCGRNKLGFVEKRIGAISSALNKFYQIRKENLDPEELDLNSLLVSLVDEIRSKNPGVEIEKAELFPTLSADKKIMEQVFRELIQNGIRFNASKIKKIRVGFSKAKGSFIFSVSDNGIGLAENNFAEIFKMFVVVNRAENVVQPGDGIGLTLVKRGVTLHGGRVWLESEEGVGSTFYFALPAK